MEVSWVRVHHPATCTVHVFTCRMNRCTTKVSELIPEGEDLSKKYSAVIHLLKFFIMYSLNVV